MPARAFDTLDLPTFQSSFLGPTRFCDSEHKLIRSAASNIARGCDSSSAYAQRVFYWVRDNIRYELGLAADAASETLLKGAGSCTNKANLAVALLRARNVPACFHLMQVHTRDYLGPLCTPRFSMFMSYKSIHTYLGVQLAGRWIKIDPTDDVAFTNSARHLARQATPVEFDGESDARLLIDPAHVILDDPERYASIDHVLGKRRTVNDAALCVMNAYMRYMRERCIVHETIEELEECFFAHLQETEPGLYADYWALAEGAQAGSLAPTSGEAAPVSSPVASAIAPAEAASKLDS